MKQNIKLEDVQPGDTIRQEWLDADGLPRASEWVHAKGDWIPGDKSFAYFLLARPVRPIPPLPTAIHSVVLLANAEGQMSRGWVLIAPDSWQSLHRIYVPIPESVLVSYMVAARNFISTADKFVIHDAKDN